MVGWWDVGTREQMRMRKRSEEELADENALIYVRGSHCWYCMGTVWSCIALLRKGHSAAVENQPQERYTCTLASNRVGEKEGERKGKGGRKEEGGRRKRNKKRRKKTGEKGEEQCRHSRGVYVWGDGEGRLDAGTPVAR